jgi:hypothetical protein
MYLSLLVTSLSLAMEVVETFSPQTSLASLEIMQHPKPHRVRSGSSLRVTYPEMHMAVDQAVSLKPPLDTA